MIFLLLIVIQVAVFATLILVLKNILQRNYGNASSHLEGLNQEAERRLADARQKTDEANAYYEQMVASAKADTARLKQQLLDEGLKEKQDLVDRARKEANEIMERARSAKKLLEENWDWEITNKARVVALEALQSVMPSRMTQDVQSEWIRQILESGMEGIAHLNVPEEVSRVKIVSAQFLSEPQKKAILAKLQEKISRYFEIDEVIDPTLILGFRMELGSVVIDGSLFWKIKDALRDAGNKENT